MVDNEAEATITKEALNDKCLKDSLYHLRIPDFDLFTSLPACYFARTGLNDTLLFHPDTTGTSLSSLSFDILDRDFLASVEKNPRKRRLLTTKYFEHFTTKAILQQPLVEGARPIFTKYKYDSIGRELKEKQPGQPAAEENQSFFSKYWMYIMIAMVLLPNLIGGGDDVQAAAAGAGGGQKK